MHDPDLLHLLSDGPRDQLRDPLAPYRLTPAIARELWAEHGEHIASDWQRTGHRPSWYWRNLARDAGIPVPAAA